MYEVKTEMNCPTFQKQELVIKDITDKINRAKRVHEKVEFAQGLQKEIGILLNCSNFNVENSVCNNCHFIANLRKKTVDLIIRTQKLSKNSQVYKK